MIRGLGLCKAFTACRTLEHRSIIYHYLQILLQRSFSHSKTRVSLGLAFTRWRGGTLDLAAAVRGRALLMLLRRRGAANVE